MVFHRKCSIGWVTEIRVEMVRKPEVKRIKIDIIGFDVKRMRGSFEELHSLRYHGYSLQNDHNFWGGNSIIWFIFIISP